MSETNLPAVRPKQEIEDPRARQALQALQARRGIIENLLPKHIDNQRFIRQVMIAIQRNPDVLRGVANGSLIRSALEAACVGLDCSGSLGSGYLVPYGDEVTFIPGYRGLIDLARRSGEIQSITADAVYDGDFFEFEKGDQPRIVHRPDLSREMKEGELPAFVYAIAWLKDGGVQRLVLSRRDILKVKGFALKKSRNPQNPMLPWNAWPEEMAKKTAIRRLFKLLPVSTERLQSALEHDEHVESGQAGQSGLSAMVDALAGLAPAASGDAIPSARESAVDQAIDATAGPKELSAAPAEATASAPTAATQAPKMATVDLAALAVEIGDGLKSAKEADIIDSATYRGMRAELDEAYKAKDASAVQDVGRRLLATVEMAKKVGVQAASTEELKDKEAPKHKRSKKATPDGGGPDITPLVIRAAAKLSQAKAAGRISDARFHAYNRTIDTAQAAGEADVIETLIEELDQLEGGATLEDAGAVAN